MLYRKYFKLYKKKNTSKNVKTFRENDPGSIWEQLLCSTKYVMIYC